MLICYILRKRGLIMNVGSFSGAIASPMLATYSASKAFLQTFSDALAAEVRPKGVLVQCLNTYFVVRTQSRP
jgi:17beta-estradiol 17-dehydrogenase / very-long-chain 3-oxoacyl-CoA reductase